VCGTLFLLFFELFNRILIAAQPSQPSKQNSHTPMVERGGDHSSTLCKLSGAFGAISLYERLKSGKVATKNLKNQTTTNSHATL